MIHAGSKCGKTNITSKVVDNLVLNPYLGDSDMHTIDDGGMSQDVGSRIYGKPTYFEVNDTMKDAKEVWQSRMSESINILNNAFSGATYGSIEIEEEEVNMKLDIREVNNGYELRDCSFSQGYSTSADGIYVAKDIDGLCEVVRNIAQELEDKKAKRAKVDEAKDAVKKAEGELSDVLKEVA